MSGLARALAAGALVAAFAAASRAETPPGELVEGVDVERRGAEVLIHVRFRVPVSYQRHAPVDHGKSLRVYTGLERVAQSATRGSLRLPPTDMVTPFTVRFPEADGALLIEFDEPTPFDVHASGHGITVSVPVRAGARDHVVITRDWSVRPIDPAEIEATLAAPAAPEAQTAAADAKPDEAPPPAEPFAASVQLAGFSGGGSGLFAVPVESLKALRYATVVRQEQDWSCGSAALATLLTHHYHHPLTEAEALQEMLASGDAHKVRREGFSLLDMKRYLERLGYQANGFETGLDRLARARVPAIVIVNDNGYRHFVVVKGLRHGNVLVGDPARGNRVMARAAFEAIWERGIVFVITSRREGVAFDFSADWRYLAAPLGPAVGRDSLAAALLVRPGPNDF